MFACASCAHCARPVADPEAADAIDCGLAVWAEATRKVPYVAEVRLVTSHDERTHLIDAAKAHERTAAWYDADDHSITFVRDRLSAHDYCTLAAHELGHALGLHHVGDPGLMSETPAQSLIAVDHPCLTPHDVEECANAGIECEVTCR